MDFSFERISKAHDLTRFSCGKETLDRFLRKNALQNESGGFTTTVVAVQNRDVVGYFTIATAEVRLQDIPAEERKGYPPYQGVSAVRLCRLAVDQRIQKQGLGALLLIESMRWAMRAGQHAAWKLFTVDAMDDAVVAFYERYGFISCVDNPHHLIMKGKKVAAIVQEADGAAASGAEGSAEG